MSLKTATTTAKSEIEMADKIQDPNPVKVLSSRATPAGGVEFLMQWPEETDTRVVSSREAVEKWSGLITDYWQGRLDVAQQPTARVDKTSQDTYG